MGRAFEYRKATKLKRWGHMARTFTKLGKEIAIAVKAGGPEPENNPRLRALIATCKRENMPKDNIQRAIKNAMGKDQSDYKEVPYEGYGPHGIAIFVDALTDNTTRTVGDVRSVFNKFNGNLGTQGSLSFLFDHKCVFTFKAPADTDMEELILELIDYGVDDEFDVMMRRVRSPSMVSPTTLARSRSIWRKLATRLPRQSLRASPTTSRR